MPHPSERTSTLLLDRPAAPRRSLPFAEVGTVAPLAEGPAVAGPSAGRSSVNQPALPSAAMALLATVSILEGYKWIGAIPTSDSRLSVLVFGRGGAAVFAVMATVPCLALTRVDRGAHRPVSHRLVLLATVAVVASSIVLLSSAGAVGRDAFGVADLALASALAGAVIVGQRMQRAARQSPAPTRRDASSDHPLPVT
jgi:hypothetical protein